MATKYLADVNFWLALAFEFHQGHVAAYDWFGSRGDEAIMFCRMTQQGFLRLASDRRVFLEDALKLEDAWIAYDQMADDPRVGPFAIEPPGLDALWRAYTTKATSSPKVWNDAYLAAFAQKAEMEILTFDQGFSQYRALNYTILS